MSTAPPSMPQSHSFSDIPGEILQYIQSFLRIADLMSDDNWSTWHHHGKPLQHSTVPKASTSQDDTRRQSIWMNPLNRQWNESLLANRHLWLRYLDSQWLIWKNEPAQPTDSLEARFDAILGVQSLENAEYHFNSTHEKTSYDRFAHLIQINPYYVLFVERHLKDCRMMRLLQKRFLSKRLEYNIKHQAVNEFGLDVYEVLRREIPLSKNFTFQYHAGQIELKLRVEYNKRKWDRLLQKTHQTLMEGQLLICELMNKDTSNVEPFFERCVHNVCEVLQLHPHGDRTLEQVSQDQILEAIDEVMFEVERFRSPAEHEYYNTENAFVSDSIRNQSGIPITMCSLFEEIYYRVTSTHLLPRSFPMMFMLATQENPPTIVNVFQRELMTQSECFEKFKNLLNDPMMTFETFNEEHIQRTPSIVSVYQRCFANLVSMHNRNSQKSDENLLPLHSISLHLNPQNHWARVSLLEITLLDDIEHNLQEIQRIRAMRNDLSDTFHFDRLTMYLEKLEIILEQEREKLNQDELPDKKPKTIEKYNIGDVIIHNKYRYRGVIYGYDPKCTMGEDWIQQMGVHQLTRGASQPFYHVLVHSGDRPVGSTYVAEENILIFQKRFHAPPVENNEVGRYFRSFDFELSRYVPNERTQWIYPDCAQQSKEEMS